MSTRGYHMRRNALLRLLNSKVEFVYSDEIRNDKQRFHAVDMHQHDIA